MHYYYYYYNYYNPKSGSHYKEPRRSLPLCRNDIESIEKHYVCKIRILIEHTPRSTEMPEGRPYRYFCSVGPLPVSFG